MEKTGIVFEGGAMRGLFTAGVMDVLMENGIEFDAGIGVSAGATFGCNYKSKQIGRVLKYNLENCKDYRYGSFRSFFKTGNVFEREFIRYDIPEVLYPFDYETYKNNPMVFYIVATDVETGKPAYHKSIECTDLDMEWFIASSSMPIVSQIVEINGQKLLDGGVGDSIPIRFMEHMGYKKNVVVLTQPKGFVKEKNNLLPIIRQMYKEYPDFIEAIEKRHIIYNQTTEYCFKQEREGNAFLFYPKNKLDVTAMERNPDKLYAAYLEGQECALSKLEDLKAFMRKVKEEDGSQ